MPAFHVERAIPRSVISAPVRRHIEEFAPVLRSKLNGPRRLRSGDLTAAEDARRPPPLCALHRNRAQRRLPFRRRRTGANGADRMRREMHSSRRFACLSKDRRPRHARSRRHPPRTAPFEERPAHRASLTTPGRTSISPTPPRPNLRSSQHRHRPPIGRSVAHRHRQLRRTTDGQCAPASTLAAPPDPTLTALFVERGGFS